MKDDNSSISDKDLVNKAQSGDRAAFECLCDRYLPYVYKCLRAQLPREAVEDVAQEVFIGVMKGLDRFRGDSHFRTWITTISRFKVADYYRSRERRPEPVALELEITGSGGQGNLEERVLVRTILRQLPTTYQEILILRFGEGLPFKKVAAELDISLAAAKSRYRRAIKAMAKEIEAGYEELGTEDTLS